MLQWWTELKSYVNDVMFLIALAKEDLIKNDYICQLINDVIHAVHMPAVVIWHLRATACSVSVDVH